MDVDAATHTRPENHTPLPRHCERKLTDRKASRVEKEREYKLDIDYVDFSGCLTLEVGFPYFVRLMSAGSGYATSSGILRYRS